MASGNKRRQFSWAVRQTRSVTLTTPKTHHHFSVFFTHASRRVLLLQLLGQTLLGTDRPVAHRRVAQTARLFDQEFFDLVGTFQRTVSIGGDRQDRLKPLQQPRVLAQLLEQLQFLGAPLRWR